MRAKVIKIFKNDKVAKVDGCCWFLETGILNQFHGTDNKCYR